MKEILTLIDDIKYAKDLTDIITRMTMSRRERIATACLQGLLSVRGSTFKIPEVGEYVSAAVITADALIKALDAKENG